MCLCLRSCVCVCVCCAISILSSLVITRASCHSHFNLCMLFPFLFFLEQNCLNLAFDKKSDARAKTCVLLKAMHKDGLLSPLQVSIRPIHRSTHPSIHPSIFQLVIPFYLLRSTSNPVGPLPSCLV